MDALVSLLTLFGVALGAVAGGLRLSGGEGSPDEDRLLELQRPPV